MTSQAALFAFVALLGAAVQLAALALLVALGVPELPAFPVAWLVAWAHNFAWHRGVVFRGGSRSVRGQGARSLVAAGAGLVIQTAVFAALSPVLPLLAAGAIAAACSLPTTFLLSRLWAFDRVHPA